MTNRRDSLKPDDIVAFNDLRTECPRCSTFGKFVHVATTGVTSPGDVVIATLTCQSCDSPIAVEARWEGSRKDFTVLSIWPFAIPHEIAEAPDTIRPALAEVALCRAAGAVTAAALACRRAVELIVQDLGEKEGGLRARISRLKVTDDLKRIADGIRLVGDEAAHPASEEWGKVTAQDVEAIEELALELVRQLYITPERVRRLAARTGEMGRGEPRPRD
ncbi:MAG: DUF4145 domain-containing protein [Dehalococcoidia bacterium]|nr:MAG: DUF4145 domain-containing protein [Dehalococcoidia bacterium]